jgi:Na+-transporting NADH:ubiquinone oxidoreductase subunit C
MNTRLKNYSKIMFFVLLMGVITATLLTVSDLLTQGLIAQNQLTLRQSTILKSQGVTDFTNDNLAEVFEQEVELIEGTVVYKNFTADDPLKIEAYRNKQTLSVTLEFNKNFGAGVWGPIIGFLTLEQDLVTIETVAIISQKETPGLGAKVKEAKFLDELIGKVMLPGLRIDKTQGAVELENYIVSIVGATRTSKQFEALLNETYRVHISPSGNAVWESPLGVN